MKCLTYHEIAISGAFRLDPAVSTLDELQAKTEAAMRKQAVRRDGDIVISWELAREILTALDNAAGFGAFIPRRIASDSVGEYADSVRRDSMQAAQRLRRAAMSQGGV